MNLKHMALFQVRKNQLLVVYSALLSVVAYIVIYF